MCHLVLLLPVLALPVFWLWPLSIALPLYGLAFALSIALYMLAMKTMSMPRLNGSDGIVGRTGRVIEVGARGVTLQLGGEYWSADVEGEDFKVGDRALVTGIDRLRLIVGRPVPAGMGRAPRPANHLHAPCARATSTRS